jgi:hypothetical protein
MLNPQTSDVKLGIGTIKFVLNAQPDGPSTPLEFVFPFLTTVENSTLLELVLTAIRDTTISTDNAFSLNPTMLNPQTSDVKLGIGTIKFVLNAQPDGPSTQLEFVFPFLTTVNPMMPQVLVLCAITDTDLIMEFVNNSTQCVNQQIMKETVQLVIMALSYINTTVFLFLNWLTLFSITQSAVPRNWMSLELKEGCELF